MDNARKNELICSDCGQYESECRCLDNHVNKCDKEQEMKHKQEEVKKILHEIAEVK